MILNRQYKDYQHNAILNNLDVLAKSLGKIMIKLPTF